MYGSIATTFFGFDTNDPKGGIIDLITSYGHIIIAAILFIVLGFCSIIFNIIGAIKAKDGLLYKYPLTITFIR